MRRRIVAILVAIVAAIGGLAAIAAPSQAFYVTESYCQSGLTGQGTAAPDHDVRRWWDIIQQYHGVNLYQTGGYWPFRQADWDVLMTVRYYGIKNGANWTMDITMWCFSGADGYHDGRYPDFS
jgi:hypothetical protein